MTIHEALNAVMGDVQSVRKGDRNTQQNFSFRGIDSVVNAVGPALRKHGVIVVPKDVDIVTSEQYESRNKAMMTRVVLRIRWSFTATDGSSLEATSLGEAADAGDKVIAKAHSVALRIVLLQALCIPTDEPDPDAASHERAVPGEQREESRHWGSEEPGALRAQIAQAAARKGWVPADIEADFALAYAGLSIRSADTAELKAYLAAKPWEHATPAAEAPA